MSQALPTLSLTIDTIHCGGCVSAIKDSLLSLTGVENVEVDFRNKQVAVVFDKSVMDAQTIINAIEQNSHWCFVNQIQKAKKAKRFGTLL